MKLIGIDPIRSLNFYSMYNDDIVDEKSATVDYDTLQHFTILLNSPWITNDERFNIVYGESERLYKCIKYIY